MNSHSAPSQLSNPTTAPKACAVCGGTIAWRRWRDTNWDRVMYCSASCRRTSVAGARAGFNGESEGHDQCGAGSSAKAA
jgi:hypothetical protein